jgi:hypothetical protein
MLTGFGEGLAASSRWSQKGVRCGTLQGRVEAFAERMFARVIRDGARAVKGV